MNETIDLMLRSACLGICILLVTHFALLRPVSRKTISTISMLLAAAGVVIAGSMISKELAVQYSAWEFVKTFVFATSTPLIAWGILELFEDDFQVKTWQLIFIGLAIPSHFLTDVNPAFGIVCHVSSFLIYLYIGSIAVGTHKHDLVHERCMFRKYFMSAAALAGISFTTLHFIYGDDGSPVWLYFMKATILLALSIMLAYWALKVRENVWAMPHSQSLKRPEFLSPVEASLLTRLQDSMQEEIWRQEGLTIGKLAEALNGPEHRLRKVINQGLGYRNFAAFVNERRIEAACEVLSDPIKADTPIINIAYDVGYASLGPFNRAFKEIVGESPTEFRKHVFSPAQ
ncbi:MAG: helix-turn-helix domain-containing protein [Pseudomonadota bacterium]